MAWTRLQRLQDHQFISLHLPNGFHLIVVMKLLPMTLLGLAATSLGNPTPTSSAVASASPSQTPAIPAASGNSAVDAFFQCLWPTTDRVVSEIKNLNDLSFNKLISELSYEIIWWGNPEKWVPDLAGIGLNVTFVASCLLDVVGSGLATDTTDLTNEFLKTIQVLPRNASNTDVPGLRR